MIPRKEELLPYVDDRKEAAKIFDVSEKTVSNWMKKYDLYVPKENFGCGKLDLKKAAEIRKLHRDGAKMKELAAMYDVTFATISRVVHNLIYRKTIGTAEITVVYNVTPSTLSSCGCKEELPSDDNQ